MVGLLKELLTPQHSRWPFLLLILITLVLGGPPRLQALDCSYSFGQPIAFGDCKEVSVGGLKVALPTYSQPNPNLPLLCQNWTFRLGRESERVKHCHTGDLGGGASFVLGKKEYIVHFDIFAKCLGKSGMEQGIVIWNQESVERLWQKQGFTWKDQLGLLSTRVRTSQQSAANACVSKFAPFNTPSPEQWKKAGETFRKTQGR